VQRRRDPADARRALLRLTARGEAIFARIAPQARRSEESVRGQLSTAEAAEFSRLLDKLLAGLRSQRGNGRA